MRQVEWIQLYIDEFLKHAGLSDLDEEIFLSRMHGETRTWQMEHFHLSERSLDRHIRHIKDVYDEVQKNHPKLPERRHSAQEDWLDRN